MSGLSLRARVVAAMVAVAVVLVIVAVVITTTTRAHLIDQVDGRLATVDIGGRNFDPADMPPPAPDRPERLSDIYQGVILPDGEQVTMFAPNLGAGDLPGPDVDLAAAEASAASGDAFTTSSVEDGGPSYRVLAKESPDGYLFITGLPLTDVVETTRRLIAVEVVATAIILGALALVTWWVLRLGIRPIKQMTDAASSIAGGDLSHRVPEAAPSTEAGQLGIALNQMLGRIEDSFAQQARSEDRLRQFVADASHELRTPITTIRGYAELYRVGGLDEPTELGEAMRRTEQESIRMTRLVDDMLSLAKLDQRRPLETKPVDLAALVTDAARDASAVDPERQITTRIDGPLVVNGDEDRLRQVIANVVGNALVHTPTDAALELHLRQEDGTGVIDVVDHGPGMAPEVAARVTERFFRADPSRNRHRGGSGLGLSIADAAVEAHGGDISIDSALGTGTTVHITLPVAAG